MAILEIPDDLVADVIDVPEGSAERDEHNASAREWGGLASEEEIAQLRADAAAFRALAAQLKATIQNTARRTYTDTDLST